MRAARLLAGRTAIVLLGLLGDAVVAKGACAGQSTCTSNSSDRRVRELCEGVSTDDCTSQVACRCACAEGYGGSLCDQCAEGLTAFPTCRPCTWRDMVSINTTNCSADEVDVPFCEEFVASAVLTEEECSEGAVGGLGPGSWCARAHRIWNLMSEFYLVNLMDLILVTASLLPTTGLVLTSWEHSPQKRWLCVVVLGIMFLLDLALQIWSIVLSMSRVNEDTQSVLAANCINHEGSYVLFEFTEVLKTIRFLGVIEVVVSIVGLILDGFALWLEEKRLLILIHALEIVACVLDITLAAVEFAKFTLENQNKAQALRVSLATGGGDGRVKWCTESVTRLDAAVEYCLAPRPALNMDTTEEGVVNVAANGVAEAKAIVYGFIVFVFLSILLLLWRGNRDSFHTEGKEIAAVVAPCLLGAELQFAFRPGVFAHTGLTVATASFLLAVFVGILVFSLFCVVRGVIAGVVGGGTLPSLPLLVGWLAAWLELGGLLTVASVDYTFALAA
mmetsp:Transcript_54154/g.126004  ORF Transcript_54154/g.126004 Transcript_54154/m.126004 type:complete len:503 (+) Transcript_54154:75-1583(+)|eukprot:CAMPEP_0171078474 /NCGR_PEP_ID=MMETSP0766_2-20121228/14661_1 /TAXON_ID=439317 /ORGANISM="Gambierdiscus australes, Strain CAWD 149" /LENGTH=502 /DNA_ID=CAMNT_0011535609 /DNA_START=56 /DNA_END=1564 /DNA_ORIENTATION=+